MRRTILALDPGPHRIGWCLISLDGQKGDGAAIYGVIEATKNTRKSKLIRSPQADRFDDLWCQLARTTLGHDIVVVALPDINEPKATASGWSHALAYACGLGYANANALPPYAVSPDLVKTHRSFAKEQWPEADRSTDAIAIALSV